MIPDIYDATCWDGEGNGCTVFSGPRGEVFFAIKRWNYEPFATDYETMPPPLGKAIAQAKKLIQEAVTLIGETLKAHPELATTPAERRLTLGSPETPERPSEAVIAPQRKLRKPLLIKKLRITLL